MSVTGRMALSPVGEREGTNFLLFPARPPCHGQASRRRTRAQGVPKRLLGPHYLERVRTHT